MKIADRAFFIVGVSTILVAIHLLGGCDDGHRANAQPNPIPYWISQPHQP